MNCFRTLSDEEILSRGRLSSLTDIAQSVAAEEARTRSPVLREVPILENHDTADLKYHGDMTMVARYRHPIAPTSPENHGYEFTRA